MMAMNLQTIFPESKIRHDMMELWKETFHDSSHYIRLVFDTYFNPDNICVRYEGTRLLASLLGVPYSIRINGRDVTGMYLCGLATVPDKRRQGIMGRLMTEIETKAERAGYGLTFLIPADVNLREYYRLKGYADSSYISSPYIPGFDSGEGIPQCDVNQNRKIQINEIPLRLRRQWIDTLAQWCVDREKEVGMDKMVHTRIDMESALRENENSFFITDGTIDLEYPILAKIKQVVFPEAKFGIPEKGDTPYGMAKVLDPELNSSDGSVTFAMGLLLD